MDALAHALADEHPFDPFVRLAGVTGLRAGELAALRIRDVDLLHGEL
ncbi:hypothetical protein [Amnibacterium kyonggiense]|nr:hypothetical protein [Amnibacterium kyonggiense]